MKTKMLAAAILISMPVMPDAAESSDAEFAKALRMVAAAPRSSIPSVAGKPVGKSAPAASAAASDFCVAALPLVEGELGNRFEINCKDGKPFQSEMKSMRELMRGKGYEEVGQFNFHRYENDRHREIARYLYRKSGAVDNGNLCLVDRLTVRYGHWGHQFEVYYSVNCNDGLFTRLQSIESDRGSTAGIKRYMDEMGYGVAEDFDYRDGTSQMIIFQRRREPASAVPGAKSLEALISQLQSPERAARLEAVSTLRSMGPAAEPALAALDRLILKKIDYQVDCSKGREEAQAVYAKASQEAIDRDAALDAANTIWSSVHGHFDADGNGIAYRRNFRPLRPPMCRPHREHQGFKQS